MICHVVLYALKPGVTEQQKAALVKQARRQLPRIRGVRNFRAGSSLAAAPAGYSVALMMDFESDAALDAYRVDPAHQRFVKAVAEPLASDVLRFDFRLE